MLEQVKERVLEANLALKDSGLVILTWGNASERDESGEYMVIKPSGIDYSAMTKDDMVVVKIDTGEVIEGKLRPSSDAPTHLELYRAYPEVRGVVHTHSKWATAFAEAGRDIRPLGTTHADCFFGAVPCTRALSREEIDGEYEKNTGLVIIETIGERDPLSIPAALVKSHGPFTWGKSAAAAVETAMTLEVVAEMNYIAESLCPTLSDMDGALLSKHFLRKHGKDAYYGQGDKTK